MGLEPTNLLTASQALYQLSYAPLSCSASVLLSIPDSSSELCPNEPLAPILTKQTAAQSHTGSCAVAREQ
jgi:hypothetical protein